MVVDILVILCGEDKLILGFSVGLKISYLTPQCDLNHGQVKIISMASLAFVFIFDVIQEIEFAL
jgi:hypothetical protein